MKKGIMRLLRQTLRLWPIIPAIILATLIAFTLIPEQLAPRPPTAPYPPACDVLERNRGPSAENLLGTDYLGCDILSMMIYETRPIMIAMALSLVIGAPIGFYMGIVGGYFEGLISKVILKANNVWLGALVLLILVLMMYSVPSIVIAIIFAWLITIAVILVLLATIAIIFLALLSGIVRAHKIQLGILTPRARDYIRRARRRGISTPYIILKRVVPRTSRVILVISVFSALYFVDPWVNSLLQSDYPPRWYTATSDWFVVYSPVVPIAMGLWLLSTYVAPILLAAWLRNRLPRFPD